MHKKKNQIKIDIAGSLLMSSPSLWEDFMYAVIETGGKQYRVAPGDTVEVDRLNAELGKPVTIERVLFVGGDGTTNVGLPVVAKATVVADVVEHFRGEKKIAFKMKRRKGYHRTVGHRQEMTRIRIAAINV
jgi:large subunit ribosomal protein L21